MEDANTALVDAVARHDLEAVRDCLARGADANCDIPIPAGFDPDPEIQPTTPLRLLMFRISDSLLTNDDLAQLAEIAKLLLRHGAQPGPAMALAERRYGKYNPESESSPFMDVWHLVARAG